MKWFVEQYQEIFQRTLEILVGLLTWTVLTMPFWLSFSHPAVVAYFVLLFDVYFFYKSATVAFDGIRSYLRITYDAKINWQEKLKNLKGSSSAYHLLILPNFKETVEKLRTTLNHIVNQKFPKSRIFVVLAMEERDEDGRQKASVLCREFKRKLGGFLITFHRLGQNEVVGKASNEACAAKKAANFLKKRGINHKDVIVTSMDADSLLPSQYLSYLTFKFLNDKNRFYHFYHAPVLLYSNYWQISLIVRLKSTLDSISRLANLMRPERLIHVSTYSMSLSLLKKVGYWDTNIIPEDWHIFFQAFFTLGEKVATIPLFLPISGDAARAKTFLGSLSYRYEQERRWAWGVTDIPYVIQKFLTTPKIPFLPKFFRLSHLLESHLLWPVNFFILTLGATIPLLINPAFGRTVLGHTLPSLAGFILTSTTGFLIILIIIDIKARPARPKTYNLAKTPLLFFQWFLLPIVSFFFSSLPGLDAHTRLLLGKRLEYKVTEKV